MSQRKLINIILVICMLWLGFSGTGAASHAIAQTPPPTISSDGEEDTQVLPLQSPVVTLQPGPATDDALPGEELEETPQVPSMPYPGIDVNSDSWIGSLPHGIQKDQQTSSQINSVVLWDNGPLVTHPGGGFNGEDASVLQDSLGLGTYGFGVQTSTGNRMAEDFQITGATGWQIETISFYTYQTGTYGYPPSSTITELYLQIWDGAPNDPASSVVFGDLVTNRLVNNNWTWIYRVVDYGMLSAERPIMAVVAGLDISLSPGTYWLDWMISGTSELPDHGLRPSRF